MADSKSSAVCYHCGREIRVAAATAASGGSTGGDCVTLPGPERRSFHLGCLLQVTEEHTLPKVNELERKWEDAISVLGPFLGAVDGISQPYIDSFMRRRGKSFLIEPQQYAGGVVTPAQKRPAVPVGITTVTALPPVAAAGSGAAAPAAAARSKKSQLKPAAATTKPRHGEASDDDDDDD